MSGLNAASAVIETIAQALVWPKVRRKYSLKNTARTNVNTPFTRYGASNWLLKIAGFGV
jgi:hypothetical protein